MAWGKKRKNRGGFKVLLYECVQYLNSVIFSNNTGTMAGKLPYSQGLT